MKVEILVKESNIMRNLLRIFGALLILGVLLVNLQLVNLNPPSYILLLEDLKLAPLIANAEDGSTVCADSWNCDQGWTEGDIAWSGDKVCCGLQDPITGFKQSAP